MGTCSLNVLPQPQLKASVRQFCAVLVFREVKAKVCSHAAQTRSMHAAVGLVNELTQGMEKFTVKTCQRFPLVVNISTGCTRYYWWPHVATVARKR
jgi:hypothetical protein